MMIKNGESDLIHNFKIKLNDLQGALRTRNSLLLLVMNYQRYCEIS
jgi:hypothetical protein